MKNCLVVLPAFNVADKIQKVLTDLIRDSEISICVVDDGSTDNLQPQLSIYPNIIHLKNTVNMGKGAALLKGFHYGLKMKNIDFFISMDSDGQHNPTDVGSLLNVMVQSQADIVIGNRMSETRSMPLHRWLSNKITSLLVSFRVGKHIPDSQCGFRVYKKNIFRRLEFDCVKFDFETEVLLKAFQAGMKIESTKIQTIYTKDAFSSMQLTDIILFLKTYLKNI